MVNRLAATDVGHVGHGNELSVVLRWQNIAEVMVPTLASLEIHICREIFPPLGIPASKLPVQDSCDLAIFIHKDIPRREISMSEDDFMTICQRAFCIVSERG